MIFKNIDNASVEWNQIVNSNIKRMSNSPSFMWRLAELNRYTRRNRDFLLGLVELVLCTRRVLDSDQVFSSFCFSFNFVFKESIKVIQLLIFFRDETLFNQI